MKDDYKKLCFRLSRATINHAIASYDTINPTGVLRLAKALKEAYEELDEVRAQLIIEKTRVRMSNPPDKCEQCDKSITKFNRQWDGNLWACDNCAEETQQ